MANRRRNSDTDNRVLLTNVDTAPNRAAHSLEAGISFTRIVFGPSRREVEVERETLATHAVMAKRCMIEERRAFDG